LITLAFRAQTSKYDFKKYTYKFLFLKPSVRVMSLIPHLVCIKQYPCGARAVGSGYISSLLCQYRGIPCKGPWGMAALLGSPKDAVFERYARCPVGRPPSP
jgi:hypothetical protein